MKRISKEELEALRNSNLFDEKYYLERYPDVKMLGMDPIEHYLWIGKKLGRTPSRMSNLPNCLDRSRALLDPAVKASMAAATSRGMGTEEARCTLDEVFARKGGSNPKRKYQIFDEPLAEKFASALLLIPGLQASAAAVKVTVIMPTYNRALKIGSAIESVLNQSHKNLELIIIDDGSNDDTASVLACYKSDSRVRFFVNDHGGVSQARNTGLDNSTGEIIFYLDSDNKWTPDFVRIMVMSLIYSGQPCAYGASRLQSLDGNLIGYRGEPFNWDSCLRGNYVDMNVFCHRRSVTDQCGKFDKALRRMVDWDLILRYTKDNGVIYSPIIGCLYIEDPGDLNRITTSQPNVFGRIVQEKNLNGHKSSGEALAALSLRFAIKIPARFEERAAWGDFHFAESLKAALEVAGHEARIDFLGTWYDRQSTDDDDVAIVLRGLTGYKPIRGQLSLLWNISHPDQISYEEYDRFHGIFVASSSYADLLSVVLERDVQPLLQCTDKARFSFNPELVKEGLDRGESGVFVGNSRKTYRDLVRWSVNSGVDVDVYGQHWESFIPNEMIKGTNIENKALSETYRKAKFVLNDHWESMRDFGFVSNRIFDVLGCGGRLISDYVPSLSSMIGDAVICVNNEHDFRAQMENGPAARSFEDRRRAAEFVHSHHTFDVRVEAILNWIKAYLSVSKVQTTRLPIKSFARAAGTKKTRVGLLLQRGRAWPTSSAFIRLLAPLTTDAAHTNIEIVQLHGSNDPAIDTIDKCVVQRVAVPELPQAKELLDCLAKRKVPLFVDSDDAFHFHETHRNQDLVLRNLMARAQECWFSTATLAKHYNDICTTKRVIPNDLDPRFWRNYRRPVSSSFSQEKVRFLYMGTVTHDEDFDLVYTAFEELTKRHPQRFDLTIVGAIRMPPAAAWIRRLGIPADQGSYPKFVRWLMANNNFDVGIAPLQNSPFNHAKSDIKFLDYSAMGLLSLVTDGPAYRRCLDLNLAIGCADRMDWIESLSAILASPTSFDSMRQRALNYVWTERNTLNSANPLVDILRAS